MSTSPAPPAGRLAGKVAIVTGAGSRGPGLGNGKATAILFAREGARVLCADAVKERAEETVALGGWGRLDVLHNNVGVESRRGLFDTTEEDWDRVMAVDLKSMLLATRAAAKAMVERGGGAIVCVSSVAAMRGAGRLAYSAAKAGVIGFVRSVAVELGPRGVRINAIAPGPVWTPMVESMGEAARERRRRATPLGIEGTGWDVAWGAVYLASDEARWVTGQTLVIDAGITLTTANTQLR